jgi:hypothetical protein
VKEESLSGVQSPFESFMRRSSTVSEPVAVGAGFVGNTAEQNAGNKAAMDYAPSSRGSGMADAARRILDLPDFLRPRTK